MSATVVFMESYIEDGVLNLSLSIAGEQVAVSVPVTLDQWNSLVRAAGQTGHIQTFTKKEWATHDQTARA